MDGADLPSVRANNNMRFDVSRNGGKMSGKS
jgi:hypothetical protein